jgi:hypothetical protein
VVTDPSGYTTLAQSGFQCNLSSKAGTVHRQNICWGGNDGFREEVDCRIYAICQLGAGKVKATDNLSMTGDRLKFRGQITRRRRTMYIGLENLLMASLTTFTMPACEQLLA